MMTNEFKCNSCGANLTFVEGEVKVVCEYCGTQSVKNIPTTVVNEITQVTEVTQITEVTGNAPTVESLTDRGFILLEDAKWHEAFDYFKRALAINPHYAKAYIGMLCAEEGIAQENYLAHHYIKPLMKYPHFERALRFADNEYRQVLEGYLQTSTVVGARTRRRNRITGFLRTISVLLFMASAGVFVYATVANMLEVSFWKSWFFYSDGAFITVFEGLVFSVIVLFFPAIAHLRIVSRQFKRRLFSVAISIIFCVSFAYLPIPTMLVVPFAVSYALAYFSPKRG